MGTDIRQMITDGVAPENLIGVDIENTFIELGFDLFNDKERLHEYFHVLDIFSKKTWPDIFHMQLFNIIYSGSVVHLLDEEQSKQFVAIVKDLLVDGGIFFGRMVGSQVEFAPKDSGSKTPQLRYIHSVESFRKTLEQYKFKNIQIELGESELDRSKTRVSHFPRDIGVITFYAQK
jgi:predicted TPR repeat methyltransferase